MSSQSVMISVGSALRTREEEFVAAVTHGAGLLLSVVGAGVLMSAAAAGGDPWCIWSCGFYAVTLIAVYAASTLSHLYLPDHWNRLFRALDQGFIYLLIVGTFTPFVLTYLRTPFWLSFYGVLLALALIGFCSKTIFSHRLDSVAVWLYVALGWGEGMAISPMLERIPLAAIGWVVAGGLCYTLGTVFLVWDIRRYHFHAIWHVLVIAGSGCHFVAIYNYVAQG